jgi:hypothetical protein
MRRAGSEDLGGEQFGEEEWPNVVRRHLALEAIHREFEWPDDGGRVMNEDLSNYLKQQTKEKG